MSCPGDMFDWFRVRRKVELVAPNISFTGLRSDLQESFSVVFLFDISQHLYYRFGKQFLIRHMEV